MNTVKEVLRLKYLGKQSNRRIALLGLASKSAVSNYIARFEKSGYDIDTVLEMEDSALSCLLYPELGATPPKKSTKPHPDWNHIYNELKKKGMTRQLLWEEYARA